MERNRILELALEELERQKAAVLAEIETINAELKKAGPQPAKKAKTVTARTGRKSAKTAAARKAQSQRMKKYWAVKKAKSAAAKKAAAARPKARAKTAAEKKALSLKMKEIWKKRKAEAAKKKG
jgi:hypothetical protein